jgi:hypothetical protein
MKRTGMFLAALVGLTMLVDTADAAGRFSRFRLFNRPTYRTVTTGNRVEGHTEGTGTGTAVDGKPQPTPASPKKTTAKAGERVEGHTEGTGKGTKVDGK